MTKITQLDDSISLIENCGTKNHTIAILKRLKIQLSVINYKQKHLKKIEENKKTIKIQ